MHFKKENVFITKWHLNGLFFLNYHALIVCIYIKYTCSIKIHTHTLNDNILNKVINHIIITNITHRYKKGT